MFEIFVNGDRNAPMLYCDVCDELITDAGTAAVVYDNFKKTGERAKILYVHKGKIDGRTCHQAADAIISEGGGTPGWQELKTHLCHIASNVGFPSEKMAEYDKRHRDMGD